MKRILLYIYYLFYSLQSIVIGWYFRLPKHKYLFKLLITPYIGSIESDQTAL